MPLQFTTKDGMVLVQVTGMSAVFKEEFFDFRRRNTGNPKESQEGSEGTKADDFAPKGEVKELTYHYKGYFSHSAANKIVEWLKEKGAEKVLKED